MDIATAVTGVLGLDRNALDLSVAQVCARAVVVFIVGLAIMRVGNRRFLGKATPFDVLLGFVLGSVLSRAISGTAGFLPTIAASLVIVILHRLLAALVFSHHGLGRIVKGRPLILIENGVLRPETARRVRLTQGDIEEVMRMRGAVSTDQVALATIERNGTVSIVPKPAIP